MGTVLYSTMGHVRQPFPPQTWIVGWIRELECWGHQCARCITRYEQRVYFGICYPDPNCPGGTVMHLCDDNQRENDLVRLRWTNLDCEGTPDQMFRSGMCYPYSFAQAFPPGISGICDLEDSNQHKYYKYECRIPGSGWYHAENEAIDGSDDVTIDSDMNNGIASAILLFVCLIGVIFGYLIHRRRKKKKYEQKRVKVLACDEKGTKTDNL